MVEAGATADVGDGSDSRAATPRLTMMASSPLPAMSALGVTKPLREASGQPNGSTNGGRAESDHGPPQPPGAIRYNMEPGAGQPPRTFRPPLRSSGECSRALTRPVHAYWRGGLALANMTYTRDGCERKYLLAAELCTDTKK